MKKRPALNALEPIRVIHRSLLPRQIRKPRNMERLRMDEATRETLHEVCMSIFVDCTNVGVPFQDAVLAVYLSGLEHGLRLGGIDEREQALVREG